MTQDRPLKVSICHREPIVSAGLAALLAVRPDIEVRVGAPDCTGSADVVVTDYNDGLARLRRRASRAERVMIVTQRDREWDVRAALLAGVHGYLSQQCESPELFIALQMLGHGGRYVEPSLAERVTEHALQGGFTMRERQVLELLAQGCSNKLIARQLDIAVDTVKSHIKSLFGKLGATARTHAVALAARRGIVAYQEVS